MVNILFDCPNIDDFYDELKEYFSPGDKVAVVAFSFYDDYVKDEASWETVYGKGVGRCYFETVDSFKPFGIPEDNFSFINYFTDTKESARDKIKNADVIYFTGGLPDRMMDRIEEFDLVDVLMAHKGVVIGYSAGAVIQMREYHLSPDDDYPEFGYYRGIPYVDGFYLEVHYEHKPWQDESIKRVPLERGKPLYVLHTREGGIIVKDGKIKTVGHVDMY
ncbi:MAG: peptidase S51 [Ruminococcaceae bacterium]|nr:peptidase S51 [Oscillospiraceae bacterium]